MEEFEYTQRLAHIGSWHWDVIKKRLISCSEEYARIHGVSMNDIKAFERLDRNIDRCDQIIDQMLDFTRIHSVNMQKLDLDIWPGNELDEMEVPEGISLRREFELKNKMLNFDADLLRRALINVYDNACQAMLMENSRGPQIEGMRMLIKTKATNRRIEIEILDSGPGISEAVLPHILEPLYSTKSFGVGLGLSTVKQVMQQHDGDLEIITRDEEGTTMILWLPLLEENEVAA